MCGGSEASAVCFYVTFMPRESLIVLFLPLYYCKGEHPVVDSSRGAGTKRMMTNVAFFLNWLGLIRLPSVKTILQS